MGKQTTSRTDLTMEETGTEVKHVNKTPCCCTFLVVLLLLISGGLLAGLIVVLLNDQDSVNSDASTGNAERCDTSHCTIVAGKLLENMNMSVDPCEDFYQYSCGGWLAKTVIPEDASYYSQFNQLRDELDVKLRGLIEEPLKSTDIDSIQNVKRGYAACLDLVSIEEKGSDPLVDLINSLGGWAVVANATTGVINWEEDSFVLEDLLAISRIDHNIWPVVDVWVGVDNKDSDKYILKADQPSLGMPSRNYYLSDSYIAYQDAYLDYMIDIAVALGADPDQAEIDMKEVLEFETKIANYTVPNDQRTDSELLYNKMIVENLTISAPELDWLKFINAIFIKTNVVSINLEQEIVVYEPEYMPLMAKLVTPESQKKVVANYLVWRIIMPRIGYLSEEFRLIQQKYNYVLYGSSSESARWETCIEYTNGLMEYATGRMFVDEYFLEESKEATEKMIDYLQESFIDIIKTSDWMDAPTQDVAVEKTEAMQRKIGYPDWIKDNSELNKYYQTFNFADDAYFANTLQYLEWAAVKSFNYLYVGIVDKDEWFIGPAIVNAFYSPSSNSITFPAGILQPLFYHEDSPWFLNYGGIGMVIGHEIVHGFDNSGRQYDKDGNLRQWWTDESIEEFKTRADCIEDQYGEYFVEEANMTQNGALTLGENIADNGGMKDTYYAYQNFIEDQGEEEATLPGTGSLTPNQLLFINFAQVWCSKYRPEGAQYLIEVDSHSLGPYRVIGTLQNSHEFADTFKCPTGSYMNPKNKCQVW